MIKFRYFIMIFLIELISIEQAQCQAAFQSQSDSIKNPSSINLHRDSLIYQLSRQINQDSIRSYMLSLESFATRYAYANKSDAVVKYLTEKMKNFGYNDIIIDSFKTDKNIWCKNIIAAVSGKLYPNVFCISGAHYDSYAYEISNSSAPGADDNASGTAAVLEMARVVNLNHFSPNYSIKFILFGAEEIGLLGSMDFVKKLTESGAKIKLMINQDMIANESSLDSLVSINYSKGFELYQRYSASITQEYTNLKVKNGSATENSDHFSFGSVGIPSVVFQENSLSNKMHTSSDSVRYCNVNYCTEITRASFSTLLHSSLSPSIVMNLTASNTGNGTSIRLRWDGSNETDYSMYKVYVGKNPGQYDSTFTTNDTSFVINGLLEGAMYYFGVSRINNNKFEGVINETYASPSQIPNSPSDLTDKPGKEKIILNWKNNTDEDLAGYNIYRSIDSAKTFIRLNSSIIDEASFSDADLIDIPCYYYVTAIDNNGNESSRSNLVKSHFITMNHGILIVDDTYEYPGDQFSDSKIDSFFISLTKNFNTTEFDLRKEKTIKLADLGQYQIVLWHHNTLDALSNYNALLKQYLDLGGNFLYAGFMVSGFYPVSVDLNSTIFKEGDFIYDYLKVKQIGADFYSMFSGARSSADLYPDVNLDSSKTIYGYLRSVEYMQPAPDGKIIYSYNSKYDFSSKEGSLKGKPVGLEYLGDEYKVIVLSYPLFYTNWDQANSVLDYIIKDKFKYSPSGTPGKASSKVEFTLRQNYPNPFNPVTNILYTIEKSSYVNLTVYDILGRKVITLVRDYQNEGEHKVKFDGSRLSCGIYFYTLLNNQKSITKKMSLLK